MGCAQSRQASAIVVVSDGATTARRVLFLKCRLFVSYFYFVVFSFVAVWDFVLLLCSCQLFLGWSVPPDLLLVTVDRKKRHG